MEYRQILTDAAVAQLRYLLDDTAVSQHGTVVQIDGGFKVVRVIEAIMRVAFDSEAIVEEVAKSIAPSGGDWNDYRDTACDAIAAVRGSVLNQLDPLP